MGAQGWSYQDTCVLGVRPILDVWAAGPSEIERLRAEVAYLRSKLPRRNFVCRKIRNGRVRIYGRWYYPSERFTKYDGRLDGSRWRFGLYWSEGQMMNICGLHSEVGDDSWPGRACVDGKFPWYWWTAGDDDA